MVDMRVSGPSPSESKSPEGGWVASWVNGEGRPHGGSSE